MALNPGTDMEHDPQLAADYRRVSAEMPPASLDDRLRAAARREVGAGPSRKRFGSAWQMPLSLAAVVVLSVTMVLMMREEGVDRIAPDLPPPAAEAVAPQVAVESAARQGRAEASRLSPVPEALPPAVTGTQQADLAPANATPPLMAKAKSAAAPPAPAPAAPLRDESVSAERNVAPAQETLRAMRRSAPVGAAADSAAGPTPGGAATAAMSAPVPVEGRVLWHDLVNEPAEKWLQRIAEWRRAGRTADANLLLAECRRRFPDLPLPDDAAVR